jgi:hypothetical protein
MGLSKIRQSRRRGKQPGIKQIEILNCPVCGWGRGYIDPLCGECGFKHAKRVAANAEREARHTASLNQFRPQGGISGSYVKPLGRMRGSPSFSR